MIQKSDEQGDHFPQHMRFPDFSSRAKQFIDILFAFNLLNDECTVYVTVASWQVGGKLFPLNFSLSENFALVRKFSSKKYKIWCYKSPSGGSKFISKIVILSTHIFVANLQLCGKIATFCPPIFSTHDAATAKCGA